MILYLDTSALLKKYFKEPGSIEVISRWKEAKGIVTSSVAYAETMASFYRKKREVNIRGKVFGKILNSFQRDWTSFIRVEVTDDLNESIDEIVGRYSLRGFDSIHLASALIVQEKVRRVSFCLF
jgi:predicted nucleic acid-binding protein